MQAGGFARKVETFFGIRRSLSGADEQAILSGIEWIVRHGAGCQAKTGLTHSVSINVPALGGLHRRRRSWKFRGGGGEARYFTPLGQQPHKGA